MCTMPIRLSALYLLSLTFDLQRGPPGSSPIIVRIVEPPERGLAEILIGSLGLAGVILLIALVFGAALAVLFIKIRSRNPLS